MGALTLAPSMALSQTQHEMNMQALSGFQKSDKELNTVYGKLISKLDAESKKDLIASQKSWLAFRDNEAKFEADMVARGGSMSPLIYNATRQSLTEQRIKQLLRHLGWLERGR